METMLRRFGIKKVEQRDTEARLKLQKELFRYQKCADYGFPNKASCLAYNKELSLLAIGTKDGCIKIFGAPGVQLTAEHKFDDTVREIFFFGKEGSLITYCSDNAFHLWEVESGSEFREIKSLSGEERFQNASSLCMSEDHKRLYVGSESGHVFTIMTESFVFSEHVVYQENILRNVPQDIQHDSGAVQHIEEHPTDPNIILIGFMEGLIALYNISTRSCTQFFNSGQRLECLAFQESGEEFASCHSNGSYMIWELRGGQSRETVTPYGPFPCKAINKFLWKSSKVKDQPTMIFSGGMPRASYGDRHTVTVMSDRHHVAFDLTSKVIDFLVLSDVVPCQRDYSTSPAVLVEIPHTLLVMAEEELVVIDLTSEGWPAFQMPYLATLHASSITCSTHVNNVHATFYEELARVGRKMKKGKLSSRPWPITGGVNYGAQADIAEHDLLITGHEDGSVRIWDVTTTDINLLLKFSIGDIYEVSSTRTDELTVNCGDDDDDAGDEEWPPFRKVGSYDPYTDDPRLAVRKVEMCKEKKVIAVAGAAGQLIVSKFKDMETFVEDFHLDFRPVRLNIIDERSHFVWKGHEPTSLRKGRFRVESGFQPVCIAQVLPPATCTALCLDSNWGLAAVGTVHGFAVVDYTSKKFVELKCTLNPADLSGAGELGMSRRKSFKKSLRESFRRLKSRRSDRHKKASSGTREEDKMRQIISSRSAFTQSPSKQTNMSTTVIDLDVPKPVERAVEARSGNDVEGSVVRTLYFADTFLVNGQARTPSLWAGTNSGTVYIYQLSVPSSVKRQEEEVQSILAKEIHLRHRAPVMSICVIDRNMTPVNTKVMDSCGGHSVVICSEEQIKIFSLPNMSAKEKFKLTAQEGSKVRRAAIATFANKSDPRHCESCLVCLTNLGEVQVFSTTSLRRQLRVECIGKDNIMGIISCIFTQSGEGFYMHSPSEFSRFSVSAKVATRPNCKISSCRGEGGDSMH